jgi:hypothetical protein
VPAGSRARVRVRLDNPMVSGRYFLHLGVNRVGQGAGTALYVNNAIDFMVFGGEQIGGMVTIGHEIEAALEDGSES